MNKGNELRSDYYEKVVANVQKHFAPLRFLGAIFFIMASMGMISFLIDFFVKDSYNEGLFALLPVFKWVMFSLSMIFIASIVFATFHLMMLPIKSVRSVTSGNFRWRYGRLTNKERYQNRAKLWIDEEVCSCLGMDIHDYHAAKLGDEFMVLYLGNQNNPLVFAMKI